jgi:Ribbon-helix-helix protein, copG family
MRTTLTLDEDLARELQEEARREGKSFKEVVNAALRKGIRHGDEPESRPPRFQVQPKACGFRSGIDLMKLNQLHDELALEDFEEKASAAMTRR